jgi:HAD superfamily hydrolase (TIGR01662 family)
MTDIVSRLRATKGLLLDFDGPVCSVFAGYPAPDVASKVRQALLSHGLNSQTIGETRDPLILLRWVAANHPELTSKADDALRAVEFEAVQTATPTKYVDDVIATAMRTGIPVAIVSNNSDVAIREYLDRQRLHVTAVFGRPYSAPDRMKPNPELLFDAMDELAVTPDDCAFVGDTATDVEAARLAGVHSIAYAKSADRIPGLLEAGAEIVVESMRVIADGLRQE